MVLLKRYIHRSVYTMKSRNRPSQIQPVYFCKDNHFNKWYYKFRNIYAEIKMNFTLNFTPCTKITSKWIILIDLNVKHKTINVQDKNKQESLFDLGLSKELLDIRPKEQFIK